ncbi:MAG: hypothetical protein QMC79_06820 [Anaerosomatales bacterium]|nr:hypothetical protein [Anaerosomatales bacterium]
MRFDLGADALAQLKGLTVVWNGHGEPTAGYPVALYLWNPTTGSWTQIRSQQMATDTTVADEVNSVPDSFCLKCHDGSAPEGVTFPAGLTNVGAAWMSTSGDFHGAASGTGYGTGSLKPPYIRGQAPIDCAVCHDTHGSASIFHVPEVVNGQAVAPVSGSEQIAQFCRACHNGTSYEWHDTGSGCWCHYVDKYETSYHADAFNLNDGMDCLMCHGHGKVTSHPGVDCEDCHGGTTQMRGARGF